MKRLMSANHSIRGGIFVAEPGDDNCKWMCNTLEYDYDMQVAWIDSVDRSIGTRLFRIPIVQKA